MPVLILMYHRTPAGEAESVYDVPLPRFRGQIEQLHDEGVPLISLNEAQNRLLANGTSIVLTFDDGHASNRAAFEFLAARGITPISFIVRDWAENRSDCLSAREISDLAGYCDFGAHGATHADLTSLPDANLRHELRSSREFLQDLTARPVDIMALPGGRGDKRVLDMAAACGYRLVCNSVPFPHRRAGISVNRICVRADDPADYPLRLARAGRAVWAGRRARYLALTGMRKLVGHRPYAAIAKAAKKLVGSG